MISQVFDWDFLEDLKLWTFKDLKFRTSKVRTSGLEF